MINDELNTLRRLNINLLCTLEVLISTPTLTEAARRMAVGQPAMSMALRRLRDHFHDDLVLYGPHRLTPLAETLRPRVKRLLLEINEVFALTLTFDPVNTSRTITISAPESIEIMFFSRVVPRMLLAAPNIQIKMLPFTYNSVQDLFERGADVVLLPEALAAPGYRSRKLFDHALTCLVWENFETPDNSVSQHAYASGRHAALFEDMERAMFAGRAINPLITQRNISVRTGSYAMLPHLVLNTDLIVTTSDWLAQHYASMLPVRVVSPPFARHSLPIIAQWEPHRDGEGMIRWIIDMMTAAVDWNARHQWR